ncbi:hypothetical protein SETIT_8G073200v2 [Setaria italica]|uniref:DUF4220 domain-containing protein n=1 Tax=Setaria italica TaxID=4555 RepID=A0A368S550_SETIT|nr:hypothetical protein SETIT_8G073200v2 [Setaria italica]
MTAFSMQDNELWNRHLLNLVIQAAVAGYVVGKSSWPDRRLKVAVALVFVSGFYNTERPEFMESFGLTTDIMAGDAPLNTVQSITLAETRKLPGMLGEFLSRDDHHNAYERLASLVGSGSASKPQHASFGESILSGCILFAILFPYVAIPIALKKQWSQKLKQYNMINSANISNHLRYVWENCGRERDADLSMPMKKFILATLLASGTRKEWNIASTRGQLALHHRKATTTTLTALEESVRTGVDFPTSVLIWHIVTDICFRYSGDKDAATTSSDGLLKKKMSTELSNYMIYHCLVISRMLSSRSFFMKKSRWSMKNQRNKLKQTRSSMKENPTRRKNEMKLSS